MRILFLGTLFLCGCSQAVPPAASVYFLGQPYRSGGIWSYPREDFAGDEAGIAAILPAAAGLTANGEARDARGMHAAHRTLQLPAIITVTNLENGRSVRLRVHDRGPDMAGRVVAVSPRAAALLGATGPFRARVVVDGTASRQAIEGLPGQTALLVMEAAPVGRVERETLAAPAGARAATPRTVNVQAATVEATAVPRMPERLPEQVVQGAPGMGRIWLEAGRFFRRDLAEVQAARIGGRAEAFGPPGRQQQWRVRSGPFDGIAAADVALARALAQGQPDLRLAVE